MPFENRFSTLAWKLWYRLDPPQVRYRITPHCGYGRRASTFPGPGNGMLYCDVFEVRVPLFPT